MAMFLWNAVRLHHFPRAGTRLQPPSTANPSSPSYAQAPSAVLAAAGGWQRQRAQLSFSKEKAAHGVFQETPDIKAQSLTVAK